MSPLDWVGFGKKFFRTFAASVNTPKDFIRMPLEKKRELYVPAWSFYVVSLPALSILSSAFTYGYYWFKDRDAPLPRFQSYVLPGKAAVYISAAETALICLFWYFVVYRLLDTAVTIRTPSVFKRIFQELLYFQAGAAAWVPAFAVLICIPLIWFLVVAFLDPSAGVLSGDSEIAKFLWLAAVLVLALVPGMIAFVIEAAYTIAFARALFDVGVLRALVLAIFPLLIAPAVFVSGTLFFIAVHAQGLPYDDRKVIDYLKDTARIEDAYMQRYHRYSDYDQLMKFASSMTDIEAALGGYLVELQRFKEAKAPELSHTLEFQLTKRGGYAHALPKTQQDSTARSYVIDFKAYGVVWSCECEGRRGHLFDDPVVSF